ncbi:hypothetical protein CCANI_02070 [Corynebacterium canis]|nr:hypothetical protein CCANI_02070 [Corynebacterium canis]
MACRHSSPAKALRSDTLYRNTLGGVIAALLIVCNLLSVAELNGVYRYFLHQNPEICVKHIAAAALDGPG